MKANELQIGDWVHYIMYLHGIDNPPYEKYVQVENMYGSEINCKVRDYNIISGMSISRCQPIPLTDDILKLNGWEISKWNCILKSYKDNKVYMGLRGNDFVVWMDVEEYEETHVYYADYILPKPNYVHELQHCLRLVGLNDLADKFKVRKEIEQ